MRADEIRGHVIRNHFEPARAARKAEITLRAGDVHKELLLVDRMPAVCSVLGSNRLEREARVKRLKIEGPHDGANALFTYEVLA
jgi:5-methylcytosine-specific restriction protein B